MPFQTTNRLFASRTIFSKPWNAHLDTRRTGTRTETNCVATVTEYGNRENSTYLGGNVCAKDSLRPAATWSTSQDPLCKRVHFSYDVQLSDRQELLRSSRNLNQKMTPWHKEHSNGLRSQDHILRTQARLCARPVPLENRVFLTRNKLILKPGHVGKKTHSCTTWNSRIAKNLPGLAGIPIGKMSLQTDQKHSGGLCSRDHISQAQARIPANLKPCKSRQRKLSDGTKNVEIRHRELGQIRARTGTRFKKKRAGSKMGFSSPDSRLRAQSLSNARNKLIREPGCVGKITTPATTWNSRFAESIPRLTGIFTGKTHKNSSGTPTSEEP
uniref:Uncharacterized protein n=1 Tax=Fagus sylvatica TaxID=28930 RepID=A0A2N9FXM8_FAGSY